MLLYDFFYALLQLDPDREYHDTFSCDPRKTVQDALELSQPEVVLVPRAQVTAKQRCKNAMGYQGVTRKSDAARHAEYLERRKAIICGQSKQSSTTLPASKQQAMMREAKANCSRLGYGYDQATIRLVVIAQCKYTVSLPLRDHVC